MGFLDMLNLVIFCMADGILSMLGAVYCSSPDFLYIKGSLMMSMAIKDSIIKHSIQIQGIWVAESSVEVVLALNRCLFICAPNIAITLFGSKDYRTENRVWLWMVPPTLWGLLYLVQGSPAIFTSIYHIETWNPHRGYFDDMIQYVSFLLKFLLKFAISFEIFLLKFAK